MSKEETHLSALPGGDDAQSRKVQEKVGEVKLKEKYPNLPPRSDYLQKQLHKPEQKHFNSADYFMAKYKLEKNKESPKQVPDVTGDHRATSQVLPGRESSAFGQQTTPPNLTT
uniref:cAMP-regulated phosphoprotein 19-B-like n=1 Tax=Myxine glutinosa TaxID=7769 RepID=UPI00358E04B9